MKPNNFGQPNEFDNDFVERQLKCFGLAEYKNLMEQGFPNRIEFDQLLDTYSIATNSQETIVYRVKQQHKKFHLSLLLRSVGLDKNDFKLGNTRVCFRPLKHYILDKVIQPKEDEIAQAKKTYQKKLAVFRRWSKIVEVILKDPSILAKSQ